MQHTFVAVREVPHTAPLQPIPAGTSVNYSESVSRSENQPSLSEVEQNINEDRAQQQQTNPVVGYVADAPVYRSNIVWLVTIVVVVVLIMMFVFRKKIWQKK